MMLTIFLDTGPLGIITNPKKPVVTVDALLWAATHIRAGNRIMVPSIADYEVRRELVRLGKWRVSRRWMPGTACLPIALFLSQTPPYNSRLTYGHRHGIPVLQLPIPKNWTATC